MLKYKPMVDESVGEELDIDGGITFQNVTFKYPLRSSTPALTDLSFHIHKG